MIDFTRAFDSAWERMLVILFRPFDLTKWFVIGFSAFLAGLLKGGNGFSSYYNGANQNHDNRNHVFWQAPVPGAPQHEVARLGSDATIGLANHFAGLDLPFAQTLPSFDAHTYLLSLVGLVMSLQLGIMIGLIVAIFFVVLALILLFYWLGARGQFLLLDNIVRNRGAIVWPWKNYSRQGNSLFLIHLLFLFGSFVIIVPIVVVGVVMGLPYFRLHRWPEGTEILGFAIMGFAYFIVVVSIAIILFLFREFGVPLMFRNGLMAIPAFVETMGLVRRHPASIALFVLLRIALAVATMIISIIACCFCCIGAIPYIGTVAILPALIYVRCFALDCLAQFGPQYDVWTVDVPPPGPQGTSSFSPPPPLG